MYPLPDCETERLETLRSAGIMDSGPSEELNAVVEHVRDLFNVPIGLVSLVAEDHQWFKANCGLAVDETSRDVSFCAYTIMGEEVFVVEDAAEDPRFSSNSLVTGDPYIRFYAGAPLIVRPGIALGSLCVIGREPRTITPSERLALSRLAKVVTGLIGTHRLTSQAIDLVQQTEAQRFVMEAQGRELTLRDRRFRQTEAIAQVGGWELDLSTGRVSWSDEIYRIYDLEIGIPVDFEQSISVFRGSERRRLEVMIERTLRESIAFDEEFEIETSSGRQKWVRFICDVETIDGVARRLFGTFQDVSEKHREKRQLWEVANRDVLTGFANRHRFNHLITESLAAPEARTGLLMVDADHLKEVNDTLGHAAGDELIRVIASRLADASGSCGTVARIGGDEFAVLFSDISDVELERKAAAIIDAIPAPISFFGNVIKPQVSIGGAIRTHEEAPDSLRQNADLALYRAKRMRRGGYVAFEPEMRVTVNKRIHAIKTVDAAIFEDRIVPWYQPVIRLSNRKVSAVEALARIRDDDGRIHSIGQYADALQDHRTAARLTQRMLDRIAADVSAWRDGGVGIPRIAVNAGMPDFRRSDLFERLQRFAEMSGVGFGGIALEITESVFLTRSSDEIARVVHRLRDRGVVVALDDFGTGYASLSYLRSLPVDVIKIDQSFTARILDGGADEAIAMSIIELAYKLGIEVIAEGVETDAQLAKLAEWGCHKVQGYLFSRPLPERDAAEFINAFKSPDPITTDSREDARLVAKL